ncbi:MAG: HEAT repeat domain-containing protein [Acidobacteriota bacterium]
MESTGPTFSLREFVSELAIAWRKLLFYPEGHPAREGALEKCSAIIQGLVAPVAEIKLGVAKEALISDEEHIDGVGVALVANALYLRNVAVITFSEGIATGDLLTLLEQLQEDVPEDSGAEELAQQLSDRGVTTIAFDSVDYSSLMVTGELDAPVDRRRSLWDRILEQYLGSAVGEAGEGTLAQVMELINRFLPPGLSEGGEIPPEVQQLAERLADALDGHLRESSEGSVVKQVTELLGALPKVLRIPVLEQAIARLAGSDGNDDGLTALFHASNAADLISSIRRLRDSKFAFSGTVVQLIEGLVSTAPASLEGDSEADPDALRQLMQQDLEAQNEVDEKDFAIRLPNARVRFRTPAEFDQCLDSLAPLPVLQSLLTTLLTLLRDPYLQEEGAVPILVRLESLFARLVSSSRAAPAAALAQQIQHLAATPGERPGVAKAAAESLRRLIGPQTVQGLMEAMDLERERGERSAKHLVDVLGPTLLEQMLAVLDETNDRHDRRNLFDLLTSFPAQIVPLAVQRLQDPRWFVVRNMIALLAAVDDRSTIGWIRHCLGHGDSRVRLEAVKSLVRLDHELPEELIARSLADEDERIPLRMAHGVGNFRVMTAVAPLLALLDPRDPMGRNRPLRIQALKSLGQIGDPAVLPRLEKFFVTGLVPQNIEERRAAYQSLSGYPQAAVWPWINVGLKVRDGEIRALCEQLSRRPAS